MTAVYSRIVEAGLDALENATQDEREQQPQRNDELVAALEAHVATLTEQLAVKDEQIMAAVKLADQAQQLHALQAPQTSIVATATDMDAQPQPQEKRSLWSRIWG